MKKIIALILALCLMCACFAALAESAEKTDEELAEEYRIAADQGDPEAQYNLGYAYEYGLGVEISIETARQYYRLAAEQDLNEAMEALNRLEGK